MECTLNYVYSVCIVEHVMCAYLQREYSCAGTI